MSREVVDVDFAELWKMVKHQAEMSDRSRVIEHAAGSNRDEASSSCLTVT